MDPPSLVGHPVLGTGAASQRALRPCGQALQRFPRDLNRRLRVACLKTALSSESRTRSRAAK